jgi:hypothetical protein
MARIRSIKPEFWSSEQITACSRDARLLFIGLWNFSDDAGRHPFKPQQIKSEIFPGDDLSLEQIHGLISELSVNGLITGYAVDKVEYFHITGWHHQKINRPQPAKYPDPSIGDSLIIHGSFTPDTIRYDKNSVLDSSLRKESNTSAPKAAPEVFLSQEYNPRNPWGNSTGPKWLDKYGRPCTEEGELLVPAAPPPEMPPEDWKEVLFGECRLRFADAANQNPEKLRGVIGKWLVAMGGDAQAEALVRIMDDAAQTPKANRMSWVFACVKKRRRARMESKVL